MTSPDPRNPSSPAEQAWRVGIKVHPAADLLPMMTDAELDELAADIAKNGVQQPIVWLMGQLLDGRNRVAAVYRIPDEKRREEIVARWQNGKNCIILPFEPDPHGYVVSANIHRRHLTAEQKREIIASLLKAKPERSDRETAKIARASPTTVGAVRAGLEKAGGVSKLDTRTGADGVAQPAAKPKVGSKPITETEIAEERKRIVAEIVETRKVEARAGKLYAAEAAPKTTAQTRAQAIIGFSTLLHSELPHTLDALARILRDERAQIAKTIPISHRVVLARGYLDALGISPDDLRPIEVAADKGAALTSPTPPLAADSTEPKPAKRQPDKRNLSEKIVATLKEVPGLTRTALNARTGAYGYQIEHAIETGMIVERDGALFVGGAA
jgi:hypothetical protein